MGILEQTGLVARLVLGILFLFSLISWAMIFQKWGMFGRIRRQSAHFLQNFRAAHSVTSPQALAASASPFANVYSAGYRELQMQVGGIAPNPHPPKLKSLNAVTVSMQLQSAEEVRRVEKGMSWLATTGSVTPFIGLFGTVWGIIDAFAGLGSAGAASRPEYRVPDGLRGVEQKREVLSCASRLVPRIVHRRRRGRLDDIPRLAEETTGPRCVVGRRRAHGKVEHHVEADGH